MAKANLNLIEAIRKAAQKIKNSKHYQWGHMGSCNCGHLAQEITKLSKSQIHEYAMRKYGDWTEQCMDYCPTSRYPMDLVISTMLDAGLDIDDLKNLERLSDREVLKTFPIEERNLRHNVKQDVVKYMMAWAKLLEEQLIQHISLPSVQIKDGVTG
ncbi:hypothetical protein QQ008_00630 [Fulvivirgaceae bacterium BMA10]|uniref:Uncharacterized protein n=1 Tax=Splendidivirga corallicola TaxID=3051826 RepID=A0ABT8KGK9_9BACT|nr:hypothetical protein [Fulvivirgaceae bacterium BMA10]